MVERMMGLRASWGAWAKSLLVLIAMVIARPTYAQAPRQTAQARTLFEEGVALADRGDWVGAADRFERAYSLKPTSGIAFNWASALAETGRLLNAQELLLRVERDSTADAELKRQCERARRDIEPRIAKLRVRVTGATPPDARIEVDGEPWARAAWDVTSPIDPGLHTVSLIAEGLERARAQLTLPEGAAREVVLSIPGTHENTVAAIAVEEGVLPISAPAAPAPVAPPRDDRRPLRRSWMVWTAVGAVVAGGVIATVLLTTRDDAASEEPFVGNGGVVRW
jgi:hypothetical protein